MDKLYVALNTYCCEEKILIVLVAEFFVGSGACGRRGYDLLGVFVILRLTVSNCERLGL